MSILETISMKSKSGYSDREIECELNGEEYKEPKKRHRYFCMGCKLRKAVDY